MAACVVFAPCVSSPNWWVLPLSALGLSSTLPVPGVLEYPLALQGLAVAAYLPSIIVCLYAWYRTRPDRDDRSQEMPTAASTEGKNEYHALALAFFAFAGLSLGPYPWADVPAGLGELARANAAWLWFASVVCGTLKDAAER